jgi:hypothetical protein
MRSDCTHICGLVVNPSRGSGPDGQSRTGSSSEKRPVMASPVSRVSRRRSDRSHHQLLSLALRHTEAFSFSHSRSGACGRGLIGAARRQQRPHDAGVLGGQRDHRFVKAAPGFEGQGPAAGGIGASGEPTQDGARAVNQQRAEIDIPPFGDPAQSPGPAAGVLSGHHAQPRRKLAAVLEGVRITGLAGKLRLPIALMSLLETDRIY